MIIDPQLICLENISVFIKSVSNNKVKIIITKTDQKMDRETLKKLTETIKEKIHGLENVFVEKDDIIISKYPISSWSKIIPMAFYVIDIFDGEKPVPNPSDSQLQFYKNKCSF